jgi:hypothetical protein
MHYIEGAKKEGGKIVVGGKRWDGSENGFYVEPTIITDVTPEMTCVKEEVSRVSARGGQRREEETWRLAWRLTRRSDLRSDLRTGHLDSQVRDGRRSS